MSLLRSPTGSGIEPIFGGSQPNLTEKTFTDTCSHVTFRNKRKGTDDSEIIKTELSELRKQMSDMMAMLTSTRVAESEAINKICQDVASIKNEVSNISSTIENIILENKNTKSQLTSLTTITENTEKRVKILEDDINQLRNKPLLSTHVPLSYEEIVSEFRERNLRTKNIIISGIPEQKTNSASERQEKEEKEVINITKLIYKECPKPEKIMRLGKYIPNRTRAVKVTFTSEETAKIIMRNKNSHKIDNIKIFSDQTPHQRRYMQSLIEELNKRTANGETNLIIKYIRGIPKIISAPGKQILSERTSKN